MKTNRLPEWKIEDGEFIFDCEWAGIEELKDLPENNKPMLRVYRNAPESLNIQIRTFDGIGWNGKGAKRNMIATLPISFDDAEALIAYIQKSINEARRIRAAVVKKNKLEESNHGQH